MQELGAVLAPGLAPGHVPMLFALGALIVNSVIDLVNTGDYYVMMENIVWEKEEATGGQPTDRGP
ncbi:hypothetical protein [Acuticoccus sp.]|uniref:hypothetical protein n=1 Tax=Acuticoccus sp. TaxID=1904378 RepID=UPI003B51EF4B